MARRHRRKNPMPTTGSIYVLRNPRRKKNKSHRRAKRTVSMARVFARLKNGLAVKANPRRRRNRAAGRDHKGRFLKLRMNRKHNRGRGRRRNGVGLRLKNGIAARVANPRRRNGVGLRIRNGSMQLSFLSPVTGLVSKIPMIGKMAAPIVGVGLSAALVVGGVHVIMQYAMPYLPAPVAEYVTPIGYTVGGAVVGAIVAMVPSKLLSPSNKAVIASLAVAGGGAIDAIRYLSDGSSSVAGMGDGGLWQLAGADDGILDSDESAMLTEYGDAEALDAMSSGDDLDLVEGEAALAGPRQWRMRFPAFRRMTHKRGNGSRHAGKHGHRWGWLIKMIGPKRFRALASLPAEQRVAYIRELRKFAVSKAEEAIAQIAQAPAGPAALQQVAAPATAGWGALLIAQ